MVEPLQFEDKQALLEWIEKNAQGMKYMLAFADDGVIWGRFDGGKALLAPEISPELHPQTLQRAYLFGETAQILVYKDGQAFRQLLTNDDDPGNADRIELSYILWGEGGGSSFQDGFTLMVEGRQGLRHMLPLKDVQGKRAALKVRHYVDYDEQNQAYIKYSRLVDVVEVQEV
jgi:CRISPR-associated protein (TIGR03984 family)